MQDGEVVAFQGEKSGSAALQKMNRGEVTILERSEKSVRIRLKIKAALFQDGDKGKRKGSVDFKIDKVFDLEISKFAKAPKQDHWRR